MRLIFRPNPRLGYELTLGTSRSVGDSGSSSGDRGMGRSGKGRDMSLLAPTPLGAFVTELSEFNERGRWA